MPWDLLSEGVDGEILERLKSLLSALKKEGCQIETITLPHCRYSIAAYYVLTMAEASSIWLALTACDSDSAKEKRLWKGCIETRVLKDLAMR